MFMHIAQFILNCANSALKYSLRNNIFYQIYLFEKCKIITIFMKLENINSNKINCVSLTASQMNGSYSVFFAQSLFKRNYRKAEAYWSIKSNADVFILKIFDSLFLTLLHKKVIRCYTVKERGKL